MKDSGESAGLLGLLDDLCRLESALAEFYGAVAERRPSDTEFWIGLQKEERQHEACIRRMIALVSTHRERFTANRPFSPAAIRTFLGYVGATTQRLKRGEIPTGDERPVLALARDMEQSVIESRFHEVARSSDLDYQTLVRQVMEETVAHRSRIVARLAGA